MCVIVVVDCCCLAVLFAFVVVGDLFVFVGSFYMQMIVVALVAFGAGGANADAAVTFVPPAH